MKILVPIKKVLDYAAKIKVKSDGSGVETANIKNIVNPFDEIAVEEALKLKEAGKANEVVVVSIGDDESVQQLRYALAMGADRAILVKCQSVVDSDLAAQILAKVYAQDDFQLIIMGKQAIDSDANQTGQILAARLDLPQACFASKLEIEDSSVTVTREVDGGLETIRVSLPAVVTTDLRLNEPRYASLPGIMKAKKKPLDEIEFESLGISSELKVVTKKYYPPQTRSAGKKVADVNELVDLLKNEAKVL